MPKAFSALARRLGHPRAHLVSALIGVLLVLPSVSERLVLDDHVLALQASELDPGVRGLGASMFHFTTGRREDNHALMDAGVLLPWWSNPQHLNGFFRPLTAWTHRFDFATHGSPAVMHLHSILWFAALLLIVAHVYRRIPVEDVPAPVPWLTGFAFLLFALDDAHGATVGWIANRNALVAVVFALPALGAHHRFRLHSWRPGVVVGPACFAVGLAGGETAVAVFGYLLAHALWLERDGAARRLLGLAPYLVLLTVWRLWFEHLGLGSAGSGAYHDPGRDLSGYLLHLVFNLPVLLSAQLGAPLADAAFWAPPALRAPILGASLLTLGVLGIAARKLLAQSRVLSFWATGMVLSACAVAASLPGERLLLVVGVGAAPVLAALIAGALTAIGSLRVLGLVLLVLHVPVAAVSLPVRARAMEFLGSAIDRAEASIPTTGIRFQDLVVVNAPFDVMVSYLQPARAVRGVRRPAHVRWLATASSPIELSRTGERELTVAPRDGYLSTPPEQHYRGDPRGLGRGARVTLTGMTAEVLDVTTDGRPARVRFAFDERLDSGRYRFVRYLDGRFVPFALPAEGEAVELPREDFFRIVLQEALP